MTPCGVRLRPEIVAVPPYKQGRPAPADGFKLSSNENPFPPLPSRAGCGAAALARAQPLPERGRRRPARRAWPNGTASGSTRCTSGTARSSLLAQLISAAAGAGRRGRLRLAVVRGVPGLVTVAGATSVQVPNRPDGRHDLDAMADGDHRPHPRRHRLHAEQPDRHRSSPAAEFDAFMARGPRRRCSCSSTRRTTSSSPTSGRWTASRCSARYPNLVVLRTFSKAYGLAALRIGYAVGTGGRARRGAVRGDPALGHRRRPASPRSPRIDARGRADGARGRASRMRRDELRAGPRRAGLGRPGGPGQLRLARRPVSRPARPTTPSSTPGLTVRAFAAGGHPRSASASRNLWRNSSESRPMLCGTYQMAHPAKRLG